ncbi:MAG: septal ring lytic transglycosylase RlpA family protein [Hyphomicrobiaceae bacterium]|nr:septal ring lytic transglycosylase RlpA family protein [Hyphomicrobiaceae bacterium]
MRVIVCAGRLLPVVAALGLAMAVGGCADRGGSAYDPATGTSASPRVWDGTGSPPSIRGRYKLGSPYVVSGRTYVPMHEPDYDRVGIASWYGDAFHGRLTANGEVFDMHAVTAAHPTLPLPSLVRVTSLDTGRSVVVRVNDRGPFVADRIIDLSRASATRLGLLQRGTGRVRVEYLGPAPLDG